MSKWPENASPEIKELAEEFFDKLLAALDKGATEYGEESFEKPGTADEILAEVIDVAGWAFVAYVQLKRRLLACEIATRVHETDARKRS